MGRIYCAVEKQSFAFGPNHCRPKHSGQGGLSSSLPCINMGCVTIVAPLLMIAYCGGLSKSPCIQHVLWTRWERPWCPRGWWAVGMVRHHSSELGVLMAAPKLEDLGLSLKSWSRSVPRNVWPQPRCVTAGLPVPSPAGVTGRVSQEASVASGPGLYCPARSCRGVGSPPGATVCWTRSSQSLGPWNSALPRAVGGASVLWFRW